MQMSSSKGNQGMHYLERLGYNKDINRTNTYRMRLDSYTLSEIEKQETPRLDLSGKNLGLLGDIESVRELCEAMRNNYHIKSLILSHNSLDNRCVPLLLELTQLENLVIDNNNLNDACVRQLAESHLQSVDISFNNLSETAIDILIQYGRQTFVSAENSHISPKKRQELSAALKARQKSRTNFFKK